MASSASSSFVPRWTFDVFLSFRGEDTRTGFISHLHHALQSRRVNVFIDNDLRRGEHISPGLIEAIEGSRIAIVVFSPNFAASSWCLDELVKILECRESKGQLVRPVFLYVDPSDMRKERAVFATQMAKHGEDFSDNPEKIRRWRVALREASNLSGWHLGNGVESELVQKIVEEVSSKLSRPYLSTAVHPIRLDSHEHAIHDMLFKEGDNTSIVAICGISGVGKTTIAKALYNLIADQFEGSSFLEDARETMRQHGPVKLQEALLRDVLGLDIKVGYAHVGTKLIKEKLAEKRVLLVIDDIDNLNMLNYFTGDGKWFGKSSRIIVTTREEEKFVSLGIKVYKVPELSHDNSLQLFCWNAFGKPDPARDYELLSFGITRYAKGIPLFLIVLGSYLKGKSVLEWDRVLNRLKAVPGGHGSEVLKISIDGLEAHERAIFLDIACFFKGEDRHYVVKLLDRCNFYPESGLQILVEKSLISFYLDKIWMHDLLQEMGRDIVFQESPDDPGKRSRLWYHEDVIRVIKENLGTSCVEGIKLDMLEPEELFAYSKSMKKMKMLRLVIVRDIHVSGCPGNFLDKLSWLDIPGISASVCSLSSIQEELPEAAPELHPSIVKTTFSKCESGVKQGTRKLLMLTLVPVGKVICCCWYRRLRTKLSDSAFLDEMRMYSKSDGFRQTRAFSLEELLQATDKFSSNRKIGIGSFGSVYYGILANGLKVAIKREHLMKRGNRNLGRDEFIIELNVLSQVHHKNLVRLVGYLNEKDERAIVYEYMSNGSLRDHLKNPHEKADTPLMSWAGRIKIALGAARGIAYLHSGMQTTILHRDVKASNILLDDDFTAKISDLGSSMLANEDKDSDEDAVSSPPTGTAGYMAPEYFWNNLITTKSDVYSFGIVLFELLSGLKPVHYDETGTPCRLADYAVRCIESVEVTKMLDAKLAHPAPLEMAAVLEVAHLAADCTSNVAKNRPTMDGVVSCIESALMKFTENEVVFVENEVVFVEDDEGIEEYLR